MIRRQRQIKPQSLLSSVSRWHSFITTMPGVISYWTFSVCILSTTHWDVSRAFDSYWTTTGHTPSCLCRDWASLTAQMVKNPPAVQETWIWSLGWGDPLKKGTATHSRILFLDRGTWQATVHGVMSTTKWLSHTAEIEPCAAAAADLQRPLREFRVELGTLCSREYSEAGLEIVTYFQELISRSQSLHLFICRKSLKPFRVTSAPPD